MFPCGHPKSLRSLHKPTGLAYHFLPSRTSGGRYHSVTTSLEYVFVGNDFALANPKSANFNSPFELINRFWGCYSFKQNNILFSLESILPVIFERISRVERISWDKPHGDKGVSKRTVIRQFGPKSTKAACDWPIWTQIHKNGPWLADLDPNQPKRTVFDQYERKSTKAARDWLIRTKIYQIGPWLVNLDPNPPKRLVIGRLGP